MDLFTGLISGTPRTAGNFDFVVNLADYREDSVELSLSIKIDSEPTAVTLSEDAIPSAFALTQNYPNPFNPTTTIQYELPEAAYVTLNVYDLHGREVAALVSGRFPAGKYQFEWDASGLASGVYYYRLQANKFVETKRLILLK